MYVDGEFLGDRFETKVDVVNPATRRRVDTVGVGGADAMDEAVTAAHSAYDEEWSEWSARERGAVLRDLAEVVDANADSIAEVETRENGKPLAQSHNDVGAAVEVLEYYGGAADKHHGDTIPDKFGVMDMTVHEPYGVVGIVLPWNWPPMHVCDFAAPALATGNTVVVKPALETPLSAIRLAKLFDEHLPDGVFNVVVGDDVAGRALTEHPDVGKVAFTGHSETGEKVIESAAANITSTMMELGGKNPSIIFSDAELDQATASTVRRALYNSGQACSAPERILVHEAVHDEVVDLCVQECREFTIGGGFEDVDMGPLASEAQYDKVTKYIEIGQAEGAELVYRGEPPTDPELANGFFVGPHLFDGVTPTMRLFNEEVFGPVLSVTPFSTEPEAIELANSVDYGLTAGIWTADSERSMRVARNVEAGIVYVNNYMHGILGTPFGGYKRSGKGRKLGFEETLREFSRVKSIRYSLGT